MPRAAAAAVAGVRGLRLGGTGTAPRAAPAPLAAPWEPFGAALVTHLRTAKDRGLRPSRLRGEPLLLWSDLHPKQPQEIPVSTFFTEQLPVTQQAALRRCLANEGPVLDIGAGAGGFALAAIAEGLIVEAVDIVEGAVQIMRQRGIAAKQASMWDLSALQRFRTLVLLMNTIGSAGDTRGLRTLLTQLHGATAADAEILLDISTPDWDAVYTASARRSEPFRNFKDQRWAVLQCYLSYGRLEGEDFALLFAEPEAFDKAADATGWLLDVEVADPAQQQVLLRLRKR